MIEQDKDTETSFAVLAEESESQERWAQWRIKCDKEHKGAQEWYDKKISWIKSLRERQMTIRNGHKLAIVMKLCKALDDTGFRDFDLADKIANDVYPEISRTWVMESIRRYYELETGLPHYYHGEA